MTDDTFNQLLAANFHIYATLIKGSTMYSFNCYDTPSCNSCPIYEKEDSLCQDHSDYLSNSQVEILKTQHIEAFI